MQPFTKVYLQALQGSSQLLVVATTGLVHHLLLAAHGTLAARPDGLLHLGELFRIHFGRIVCKTHKNRNLGASGKIERI